MNLIMEETMMKATIGTADFFNPDRRPPYTMGDVLFVDVSRHNQLIYDEDGNKIIADRTKLDTLFKLLHKKVDPNLIIVCNLPFDIRTRNDLALQASMAGFPNLLTAVKTNWKGDITPNVLSTGTSGTTGFTRVRSPFMIFSNSIYHFRLTDRECTKTLPLLMYERQNNYQTACLGNLLRIGGDWFLNKPLITEQLGHDVPKAVYEDQVVSIQTVINKLRIKNDTSTFIQRRKFIMIGDFEKDAHATTFGEKPTTMILFDVFLSLQQKQNHLSGLWIIIAVGYLGALFYRHFYGIGVLAQPARWLDTYLSFWDFKGSTLADLLLFYLFVIFSATIFRIYIEGISGLLLFILISWVRAYFNLRYQWLKTYYRQGHRFSARSLIYILFIRRRSAI